MVNTLRVMLRNEEIGRSSWDDRRRLSYFTYNPEFLKKGIDVSPLQAPVRGIRAMTPVWGEDARMYQKLPAFLADSLPDAWGNQLFELWRIQNHIPNADITSPGDKNDNFNHAPIDKEQPYYYISNNWIHTNIDYGTIHLRYRALPVVYDSIINMDVPLIYNNGPLKKYLKLYVLKQMLLRGYKHPVVSLTANNPYTNPAIELDRMRIQVRVSCNKFSNDRRENIATILRTLE